VVGGDLTLPDLIRVSDAFVKFMKARKVLLARDARVSSMPIKVAIVGTGSWFIDVGMVTTPTAVYGTKVFGADAGIMITASHNPADQNGLKFLEPGRFLSPARSKEFIEFVNRGVQTPQEERGWGKPENALIPHFQGILNLFDKQSNEPRLRVGLDPVNGAAGPEAKAILEALNCEVHIVNFEPDGRFGRGGEPVPENLGDLQTLVKERGLDVGFAFDPDGDRLAFIDERGRIPGEEYTVPLCTRWALDKNPGDVAVNLSTSRLIEHVAAEFGVPVHRTPVGEAHVVDKMLEIGGSCGGEGNGGFILPAFNATRDGLLAMAVLVALHRKSGSLAGMVDSLPSYYRRKDKFAIEWSEGLAQRVVSLYPQAERNTQDGLWLGEENFWVHLRPSNTEPVVRLLLEARSQDQANKILQEVRKICAA